MFIVYHKKKLTNKNLYALIFYKKKKTIQTPFKPSIASRADILYIM